MKATKVDHWSRIGRLRRTKYYYLLVIFETFSKIFRWPKLQSGAGGTADSSYAERQMASGRLLCDTYRAAQVLLLILMAIETIIKLNTIFIGLNPCQKF